MKTCQIRWIDANGHPTPDDNPAIGYVRRDAHVEQFHGHAVAFSETTWFSICAEHAKQLTAPGMHHWTFAPCNPTEDR